MSHDIVIVIVVTVMYNVTFFSFTKSKIRKEVKRLKKS